MKEKYASSKSTKEKKGIENDQFYTKSEIAGRLVSYVKQQPWFSEVETVVEPAAGNGAFSKLFDGCCAYDIDPKASKIKKVDFLTLKLEKRGIILSIGNPPFGRQSSLALKFVKSCCEFSKYVAFILPRSFQKASVQSKVPFTHSLLYEEDLGKNCFQLSDGTDYNVPCVFQIWIDIPRIKVKLKKDCDWFEWVDKSRGQLAIRRVGFYAGTVFEGSDYDKTCTESHYYVVAKNCSTEDVKNCFSSIDWSVKSAKVSGPRSISKAEIVELFESKFEVQKQD